MERKSFSHMDCSVAQCLEVVGEWWSMLIIRDAFFGVTRFEEFQRRLGISRNILGERLHTLVNAGVLERVPYSKRPPRDDYLLTPKGQDLFPVLTALRQWGDDYAAPAGAPLEFVHRPCGEVTRAVMLCSGCGEPVTSRNVKAVRGAGHEATELWTRRVSPASPDAS